MEVATVKTRAPLANGENLARVVTVSPMAQALCGNIMEYMSFSGHEFSISNVCWYSKASAENERNIVTGVTACQLEASPGRTATACSLYATDAPPTTPVFKLEGREPPI